MNAIKKGWNIEPKYWVLKIVFVLSLISFQTNAQSVGGVPFDPLKLLPKTGTNAQDTVQKRTIEIIHSDSLIQETDTSSNTIKRILDRNVKLLHDGALMVCDNAILYPQTNYLEAHGRVKITKGDSVDVRSEILRYNGDTKIAILEKDVQLKDKESILTAPMMTYEVDKEIGHFWDNGKLVSDSTVLTSKSGTHYQRDGYAVFKGDVVLVSPDYTMYADSMKYFTNTKIAYFITKTIIVSGNDTIITEDGYFDTQKNKAILKGRPMVKNGQENTLQSDHLDYDKATGIGIATGNVVSRNLEEDATLLANHLYYIDSIKYTRATQDPLMIKYDEKDTLYISADTLINYSMPMSVYLASLADSTDTLAVDSLSTDSLSVDSTLTDTLNTADTLLSDSLYIPADTLLSDSLFIPADTLSSDSLLSIFTEQPDSIQLVNDSVLSEIPDSTQLFTDSIYSKLTDTLINDFHVEDSLFSDSLKTGFLTDSLSIQPLDSLEADSVQNDSIKIFYGYKNVKLIRTNLSGICDSIYFNSVDSIFKLYYNPILWMDSTQMKSDSIYIFMKNKEAERIELYQNAIIINESAPGVYNQIAGKKITGWLHDNKLRHVLVDGNAECIYFLKNDSNEYSGGNHAKGALINISFNEDSEIQRIKLEISPEAQFTPIHQIQFPSYKLPNFGWYWSLKPKTKWDVIRDTVQYQRFLLEHPVATDSLLPSDSLLPVDSLLSVDSLLPDNSNISIGTSDETQERDALSAEPDSSPSSEETDTDSKSILAPTEKTRKEKRNKKSVQQED